MLVLSPPFVVGGIGNIPRTQKTAPVAPENSNSTIEPIAYVVYKVELGKVIPATLNPGPFVLDTK